MESKPIASSRSRLAGKYGKKGKAGRSQLLMIKPAVMPNTPLVQTQKNRAAQFTVMHGIIELRCRHEKPELIYRRLFESGN
jgi:hypothetical protein